MGFCQELGDSAKIDTETGVTGIQRGFVKTGNRGSQLTVHRVGVMGLLLAMGLLPSLSAYAVRMQGSLRTHLYLREDRLDDPIEEFFMPVRQYLTLHVDELNAPGWSFHGSGWVRQDLGDRSDYTQITYDSRLESELLTGYLEWRDPKMPATYARFGRQYVFWSGINERFDGATYSKELPSGNGYAIFGGIPAFSDYGGKSEDLVGGGRVWFRPLDSSELGFSYAKREDDGDLAREVFNQDFYWRPFYFWELEQHISYDTITDQIVELGLYSGLEFHPKAKFTVSYNETIPGALLPSTSLLSVFSNDKIQETAFGLDFYPTSDLRFWSEAVYYDSRSPGGTIERHHVQGKGYWEFVLGGRTYYGDDATVSLELRHLQPPEQGVPFIENDSRYESIDNGYDRLRFTTHRWFNDWCWQSLELGATYYRDRVNDSPHSFDASWSCGYRPRKQLEAVATLRYIDSAVDNTEIQALLSVTYWFDKRIENGGTVDLYEQRDPREKRWLPQTALPTSIYWGDDR
ncbi:MAG: hypothetical protein H6752_16155 [Candidatus Omnitrophica bacterium]|nr:hypothetical protein [Candidatus Omnitrophota bacterium]